MKESLIRKYFGRIHAKLITLYISTIALSPSRCEILDLIRILKRHLILTKIYYNSKKNMFGGDEVKL